MSFEADAASWSVVVLTGGASRRMGSDKATLVVDGLTLLERTLSGVPDEVEVVVAGPEVSLPDGVGRQRVRFAVEDPPGGGPVAGLDAALAHVSTAVVVVLATDLPFVGGAPGVLAAQLRDADVDAVLAGDASGRPQQLCAAYRAAALRAAIAAGGSPAGASMRSVVARLRVAVADVGGAGAGAAAIGDPTWDVDTPDDVARMTALLRGDHPEDQVD